MRATHTAPLVVVEVFSPEDRIEKYRQRIADYLEMGIRGVCVIDPETRKRGTAPAGIGLRLRYFDLRIRPFIWI